SIQQAIRENWTQEDRQVREAWVRLLRVLWMLLDEEGRSRLEEKASALSEKFLLARAIAESEPERALEMLLPCFPILKEAKVRLEGLRTLQLALGDIGSKKVRGTIWEGFTRRREKLPKAIQSLESGDQKFGDIAHTVDQNDSLITLEVMRTMALLESKA